MYPHKYVRTHDTVSSDDEYGAVNTKQNVTTVFTHVGDEN